MLFSNVWIEKDKMDSLVNYASKTHTTSRICTVSEKLINSVSCTIEMLGLRNATCVVGVAKQFSDNGERRSSLLLEYVENLFHNRYYFYTTFHIPQFPEIYPKAVVLNYIHNKDGKK